MKKKKGFKDLTEKDKRFLAKFDFNKKKPCCNNPKHETIINELFENWIECINCGKEIL